MNRLVLLALCVLSATLVGQQTAPTFEVASIKPSSDAPIPASSTLAALRNPSRWIAIRVTAVRLIVAAYPEYAFEGRVVGGPAWIRNDRFDIEAVKDPSTTLAQVAPMMAHLLAT